MNHTDLFATIPVAKNLRSLVTALLDGDPRDGGQLLEARRTYDAQMAMVALAQDPEEPDPVARSKVRWDSILESAGTLLQKPDRLALVLNFCRAACYVENPYGSLAVALHGVTALLQSPKGHALLVAGAERGTLWEQIERFAAQLCEALTSYPITPQEFAQAEACSIAIDQFRSHLRAKAQELQALPEDGTDEDELGRLKRLIDRRKPPAPSKSERVGVATERSNGLTETGGAAGSGSTHGASFAQNGVSWAIELAASQRSSDPTNPLPYVLLRAALWSEPASIKDVPGLRTQMDGLVRSGASPRAMIESCENALVAMPLWLDVQSHVCAALEQLGARAAREAIVALVCGLCARDPALLERRFPDGRRCVSSETAQWLHAERERAARELPPSLPPDVTLAQSLRCLDERTAAAASGREKYLCRLMMAELSLDHGRPELAVLLFRRLFDEAQKGNLASWEPALHERVLLLGARLAKDSPRHLGSAEREQLREGLLLRSLASTEALALHLDVSPS